LNIDDALLAEAQRLTGLNGKAELVRAAQIAAVKLAAWVSVTAVECHCSVLPIIRTSSPGRCVFMAVRWIANRPPESKHR
jgi:hypothetical protein